MSTHAAFEEWAKDHLGRGYSLEKEEGVYFHPVTRWAAKAYKAATERAAKLAAQLAYDAAIKYADGDVVDFDQEVGDAIRSGGEAGS